MCLFMYRPGDIAPFPTNSSLQVGGSGRIQSNILSKRNQDHFNYRNNICFAISISVEITILDSRANYGGMAVVGRRKERKDKRKSRENYFLIWASPSLKLRLRCTGKYLLYPDICAIWQSTSFK